MYLTRWYAEREGQVEVGRVLPADYLWFSGDGERNHFRNAYRGGDRDPCIVKHIAKAVIVAVLDIVFSVNVI